jgi:nucleotide-binding universal stress UspA family protein
LINRRLERSISCSVQFTFRINSGGYLAARLPRAAKLIDYGHKRARSVDLCLHLARHGVRAEAQHLYADDLGVGPLLLSRAIDEGIDLIVCGAYGHARWREIVLGGVTRHLLEHMTIPVLMSH